MNSLQRTEDPRPPAVFACRRRSSKSKGDALFVIVFVKLLGSPGEILMSSLRWQWFMDVYLQKLMDVYPDGIFCSLRWHWFMDVYRIYRHMSVPNTSSTICSRDAGIVSLSPRVSQSPWEKVMQETVKQRMHHGHHALCTFQRVGDIIQV